ncbi:MAG: zinc ribbon domain-containing protein [Oscillospiraceae bacterium]|nr:zinc ribbon domain-containing protein [Oscillospiraceae bacterium]
MSKFCKTCGATLEDNDSFCTSCGTAVDVPQAAPAAPAAEPVAAPAPQYAAPQYSAPAPQYVAPVDEAPAKDSKYAPVSTGAFIGYTLLFSLVPIIGFIFQLVFAFGGCKKINLRNYARALLIIQVVSVVLAILLVVLTFVLAGSAAGLSIAMLEDLFSDFMYY